MCFCMARVHTVLSNAGGSSAAFSFGQAYHAAIVHIWRRSSLSSPLISFSLLTRATSASMTSWCLERRPSKSVFDCVIIKSYASHPLYISMYPKFGKIQKNSRNFFRKLLNSKHQIVVDSLLRNAHTLAYFPLCFTIVHISIQCLPEVFRELF